jgi:DNA-binding transcriptional regulator YiaG
MTNLADSLKSEIARVARKELKSDVLALRKSAGAQRSEIAALKRQLKSLASRVKNLERQVRSAASQPAVDAQPVQPRRTSFGPATLKNYRAKLGITQVQLARLLGASTLSVRRWETGNVQPRAAQLARIASVVKLGKRSAMAQLGS